MTRERRRVEEGFAISSDDVKVGKVEESNPIEGEVKNYRKSQVIVFRETKNVVDDHEKDEYNIESEICETKEEMELLSSSERLLESHVEDVAEDTKVPTSKAK